MKRESRINLFNNRTVIHKETIQPINNISQRMRFNNKKIYLLNKKIQSKKSNSNTFNTLLSTKRGVLYEKSYSPFKKISNSLKFKKEKESEVIIKIQTLSKAETISLSLKAKFNELGLNAILVTNNIIENEIMNNKEGKNDIYFFLLVTELKILPKKSYYFIYNLEQILYYPDFPIMSNVYKKIEKQKSNEEVFRNCKTIFDYSTTNIALYPEHLKEKVSYLPIPLFDNIHPKHVDPREKNIDILFFGYPQKRREKIVQYLEKQNLKIEYFNHITGDKLYEKIRRAKVVLNIHGFKDSILETARLHDCFRRYYVPVVSEMPTQTDSYLVEKYKGLVTFVPVVEDDLSNIDLLVTALKERIKAKINYTEVTNKLLKLNNEIIKKYEIFKPLKYPYFLNKIIMGERGLNDKI